jgi:hypothetical protein
MLSIPGVSLLCLTGNRLALLELLDSKSLLRLTTCDDLGLHIHGLGSREFWWNIGGSEVCLSRGLVDGS